MQGDLDLVKRSLPSSLGAFGSALAERAPEELEYAKVEEVAPLLEGAKVEVVTHPLEGAAVEVEP